METSEKIKIISEKHEYTSDLKLKHLGYGEWVEEPDEVVFCYKGFNCKVVRVFVKEPFCEDIHYFGGHLCGYLDIPLTHKYSGKDTYDVDVDCHGGVTYSKQENEKWCIGFDCAHSWDYVPSIEFFKKTYDRNREFQKIFPIPKAFEKYAIFNPVYRNIEFCINECCSIADQIFDLSCPK